MGRIFSNIGEQQLVLNVHQLMVLCFWLHKRQAIPRGPILTMSLMALYRRHTLLWLHSKEQFSNLLTFLMGHIIVQNLPLNDQKKTRGLLDVQIVREGTNLSRINI